MLSRFGDAVAKIPEAIEANFVTGDYDYLVKVATADTTHYEHFLQCWHGSSPRSLIGVP